jgi:TPR repeat protein
VFVSYRRLDAAQAAGRLVEWLRSRVAPAEVFMDDAIDAGDDFIQAIDDAVSASRVFLAVIGQRWAAVADRSGRRRLADPDDWVVWEIRAALRREIRVVPVLVDGASMPARTELPPPIEDFTRCNAMRLRHETFDHDAAALLAVVRDTVAPMGTCEPRPIRAIEESELERAARSGDTVAMDRLAEMLASRGAGQEAEAWWRRAAEAGFPPAMHHLAVAYQRRGEDREAARWCRDAAQRGDSAAMHTYGRMLEDLGALTEAEAWFRRAAMAGEARGMINLGRLLERRRQPAEAADWYQRAADRGHTDGMYALGWLRERHGDFRGAAESYLPAAEAEHPGAMFNLGNALYQLGHRDQAEHWWRRSAASGSVDAMNNLGVVLHARGDTEALRWRGEAAAGGNPLAQYRLDTVRRDVRADPDP